MGLTEKRIRDAKPGAKLVILWDETVKGLGVRVTPAGVKSFVLSYRAGGRKRLATLGRCAELSLRDARERAGRELADIREGGDPLRRRQDAAEAPTVADLVRRFLEVEGAGPDRAGAPQARHGRDLRLPSEQAHSASHRQAAGRGRHVRRR